MKGSKHINTKKIFEDAVKNLTISTDRKELLFKIGQKIALETKQRACNFGVQFICTHNSRRSQLAQVWMHFAIEYFNLENIVGYSGGTEVTAFHKNTVKTLQKVGFHFDVIEFSHSNPKYAISYKNAKKPIIGFSKLYDDESNSLPFIAITTCSSANENCPFIPNAIHRFHLPFVDPKEFDNTEVMEKKYLQTNLQIAGEVYMIFSKVKEILYS